jgi:hypothetical protein
MFPEKLMVIPALPRIPDALCQAMVAVPSVNPELEGGRCLILNGHLAIIPAGSKGDSSLA